MDRGESGGICWSHSADSWLETGFEIGAGFIWALPYGAGDGHDVEAIVAC